jgi:hypothetical protein
MSYEIIRFFKDGDSRTIKKGLTLEEVQAWCSHPETSSSTAQGKPAKNLTKRRGEWFDGYREVKA